MFVTLAGSFGNREFAIVPCSLLQYQNPYVVSGSMSSFSKHQPGFSKNGKAM